MQFHSQVGKERDERSFSISEAWKWTNSCASWWK